MYCTNCGKQLEGGEYCTNCGKKIESSIINTPPNPNYTMNSVTPKNTMQQKKNNRVLAIIGGVVALVIVISVLIHGNKSDNNDIIPYNGNTYSDTQGLIQPPIDYSNGTSDYYSYYNSDDSYDSYNYGNTSQICPSCFGSGTCPICNGTGQYSMYGSDYSECTACYGTGVCSICDGTGYC